MEKFDFSALNKEVTPLLNEMNKIIGVSNDAFNKPSLNNARQIALLRVIKNSLDKLLPQKLIPVIIKKSK